MREPLRLTALRAAHGMHSRKEIDLAVQIIQDEFGLAARKVFEAVSQRDNLTFEYIVHLVPFRRRTCGAILYTLIKHGCITSVHKSQKPTSSRIVYTYRINLAYIRCRQRFSRYALYAKTKHTREHFMVLLTIALHGAMSVNQIMSIVQQVPSDSSLRSADVHKAICDLLEIQLLQRVRYDKTCVNLDRACTRTDQEHMPSETQENDSSSSFLRLNPRSLDAALGRLKEEDTRLLSVERSASDVDVHLRRQKHVEAVIKTRLGAQALRIFRVLIRNQLEQKQVAELSMVPVKDTRDILYKLLKFGYVQMQEIARTHDHAPSRTNYLWRVDCSDVEKTVKRELIQALTNVHLRKLFEVRRYRTGIVKNERMWSSKPLKREVLKDLEVTTMRLDELLLLFDDVDVASQTV